MEHDGGSEGWEEVRVEEGVGGGGGEDVELVRVMEEVKAMEETKVGGGFEGDGGNEGGEDSKVERE